MRHIFVERGVNWEEEYPDTWDKIDALVKTFVRTILSFSKVLIFMDNENATTWKDSMTLALGDRRGVASVSSGTVPHTVFGKVPSFLHVEEQRREDQNNRFLSPTTASILCIRITSLLEGT